MQLHRQRTMQPENLGPSAIGGVAGNGLLLCGSLTGSGSLVLLARAEIILAVIELVAGRYSLSVDNAFWTGRSKDITWARRMSVAVASYVVGAGSHEIARATGKVAATIIFSLRAFWNVHSVYPSVRDEFASECNAAKDFLALYRPSGLLITV